MSRIAVIGCGYVGAVSAACFAHLGHEVECVDTDPERVALLDAGRSPIHEPGLDELLRTGVAAGRLSFRSTYPDRFAARIVFIAVNTPESQEGAADIRAVRDAVTAVAARLQPGSIIVNKSTVPIGTGDLVVGMARRSGQCPFAVVSNPEFLREGSAISDFMNPDRIVLGSDDRVAIDRVADLYGPLEAHVQRVDIRTAEMIKYASNAFLATKISFINEIAAICEALGADVAEVARGMGMDSRIGHQFLSAGLGWGGSCFPKDVKALAHMAAVHGAHPQLLRSVMEINRDQQFRALQKVREAVGVLDDARVAILGASFKANTDDIRNSPALALASLLQLEGARVTVYDPVVQARRVQDAVPGVAVAASVLEAARDAEAVVLATDWLEFQLLDWQAVARVVARPVVIDARNALEPRTLAAAGFEYRCIGRPGNKQRPAPAALEQLEVSA
ncbi:MAG: UDP-glucose/GDP-mannose dehydrogenase family protein [Dehalococcoidia bacterium]|nr:UDP-glucose/GDP-mannose dehydrogenase family protein [Dehalococcoidia bacterium]